MERGWIRLYRKIQDNDFWLKEKFNDAMAWMDLIMLANHKEGVIKKRGIRVHVERGMVGCGEEFLAKRWKWSRGKVRRYLKYLESNSMIDFSTSEKTVQKNTSISRCIKICNYDLYQSHDTENSTENGQKTDSKRYRNNNVKNVKKDNNKNYNGVFEEIITYLNAKAGTSYRHSTPKTQTLIRCRLQEGFDVADFKVVVDKKVDNWISTDMAKFLRPETLFGTKFEGYLNEQASDKFSGARKFLNSGGILDEK